jgi:hypothetical protein
MGAQNCQLKLANIFVPNFTIPGLICSRTLGTWERKAILSPTLGFSPGAIAVTDKIEKLASLD